MRIVKEISHPSCRITLFQWNGKYLIKFDQDGMEQTYKVDEMDILSEEELVTLVTDKLASGAMKIFRDMNLLLAEATDEY